MNSLRITPDRTVRNWNVDILARSFHDIYVSPLARIKVVEKKIRYDQQECFSFDIELSVKEILFWFTVPSKWNDFFKQKIEANWPRATISVGEIKTISNPTFCAELKLKHHSFYSLATNKNDNRPLNSLLEVVKDFKDDDCCRVQVLVKPIDRRVWEYTTSEIYKKHRKGAKIKKQDFSFGSVMTSALEFVDDCFCEASGFMTEFLFGEQTKESEFSAMSALRERKGISDQTLRKMNEPVFDVSIRIVAKSADSDRARIFIKAIATAFNELSLDNEFEYQFRKREYIDNVNNFCFEKFRFGQNVLSASELGKFIQLPGAELQDELKQIVNVPMRETRLPSTVTSGGLLIGSHIIQGTESPVFLPVNDKDELCLPHIVIGGMGCGKTRGFGGNLAVQAVLNNMAVVVIDPAKGEIGDEVCSILPKDKVVRVRFGKEPIALDWREIKHTNTNAKNRFANELIAFCEAAGGESGPQTVRFMRAAAKSAPNGKLSEIVSLLTDQNYRKKNINSLHDKEFWIEFGKMTDARQNQISLPVMNRLDVIMGDDYLSECMNAMNGLDFIELLDKPRAIILDVPKSELGTEAVDVLISLISTKLDLTMVSRKTTFPVFVVFDEPHQYLRSTKIWRSAAVESRKWGFSYVWMFHAWEQLPREVGTIIQAALPHYHIYSSSKGTYRALAEEIKPFSIEEAMETPRYWALNIIRVGGRTVSPFLAKMAPPPSFRK
jgi:hypothetical protein